jgi:DNA polymerase III alpha subunit
MSLAPVIPIFSSSSSRKQGGIFTLEKAGDKAKTGRKRGPISLCDLAKEEDMKRLWLVDTSFINFMNASKNLSEIGVTLHFGLKLTICQDMTDKSEKSEQTESKVILWLAKDGSTDYERLALIFSRAANEGFYYVPRLDWKTLCAMWGDDLLLSLPFYSSFLAANTLTFSSIVPELPCTPLLLREVNAGVPYDKHINQAVDRYSLSTGAEIQNVKSIYYRKRADAKPFLCWRALLKRGATFVKPNMDQMCSREFSYESWKEIKQ